MLKTSYAGCLGQSSVISSQFTLEMCVAASNREKFTKTRILGVQGRSRSSMFVPPERSPAVLVMIHGKSMSICNRSLARSVDGSRNRAF